MDALAPGRLLVATPALLDPNFADTVVLLLDADEEGAVGVVLNRPSQVPVDQVLGGWGDVVSEPEVLFHGGPVGRDGALAVVLLSEVAAPLPVGVRPLVGRLGLLDLDTPHELVAGAVSAVRIFAGYAGWGPGQLEAEVEEGSWYVVPGEEVDVFREGSEGLLRAVLRRQPGELAWRSTRPLDPELN